MPPRDAAAQLRAKDLDGKRRGHGNRSQRSFPKQRRIQPGVQRVGGEIPVAPTVTPPPSAEGGKETPPAHQKGLSRFSTAPPFLPDYVGAVLSTNCFWGEGYFGRNMEIWEKREVKNDGGDDHGVRTLPTHLNP